MPIPEIVREYRQRLTGALGRRRSGSELRAGSCGAATLTEAAVPVSFEAKFRQAAKVVSERHVEYETLGRQLWRPSAMMCSDLFERRKASLAAGHAIVDSIRRDADGFAVVPHPFQVALIELWMELSGPAIYGAEVWGQYHVEIRRRNGWNTPNSGAGAVQSGRKDGKSTGMGMCIVLGMMNIPGYLVSVFAKVHKQSRIILGLALVLARGHRRIKEFKVPRPNINEFKIIAGDNDVRHVKAHSGDIEVRLFLCNVFLAHCVRRRGRGAAPPVRQFFVLALLLQVGTKRPL